MNVLGNGYECSPDSDLTSSENPIPRCHVEMCWCPAGWSFQNSMCVKFDDTLPEQGSGEIMHDRKSI